MPPKAKGKKGKAKAQSVVIDPNALTEVDKTFYELQITDLNRKLGRLRSLTEELQVENEQLKQAHEKLNEDRNDVINYLKKTAQDTADDTKEVLERLQGLEETRDAEIKEFNMQLIEKDEEYKHMHDQLTSEIKLTTGKLNALEEFRLQRDELMKKFEAQEQRMADQEIHHKREIYEIEKKFVIGKDKLKKDMETRLLQLSTEFQDVTEMRIASTTSRVIRENIAINNELDAMLETHQKLFDENNKLKDRNRTLRQEAELHVAEKKKVLSKASMQHGIIERMTNAHEEILQTLEKYKGMEQEAIAAMQQFDLAQEANHKLQCQIRILEQNLHASKCDRTSLKTELEYCQDELQRLSSILRDSVAAIKVALRLGTEVKDRSELAARREQLLNNLLELLSKAKEKQARNPSLESVESISMTYARGDLGFVPKPPTPRHTVSVCRHKEVQVGPSFEELLALYAPSHVEIEESVVSIDRSDLSSTEMEMMESKSVKTIIPPAAAADIKTVFDESTENESSDEDIYHVELPGEEQEHGGDMQVAEGPKAEEEETTEKEEVAEEPPETIEEGEAPSGDEQPLAEGEESPPME